MSSGSDIEQSDVSSDFGLTLKGKKMNSFQLCSNVVISITGTVVLGVGSQMTSSGWIAFPLIFILGMFAISEMVWLVSTAIDVKCKETGCDPPSSYKEYARLVLGTPGEAVSSLTSTFALLSYTCGGIIILAQNMQALVPVPETWPGGEGAGQKWWALFLTAETLLFCFVDLSQLLDKAACLGPIVTFGVFFMAAWGCAHAWTALKEIPEECLNGTSEYHSMWPHSSDIMGLVSDLAKLGSYAIFTFAIVVTVPTLKSETAKQKRVVPMVFMGFCIATLLFLALMLFYYASFGSLGPENIILGMRTNRPAGWWATNQPWKTGEETGVGKALAALVNVHLCLSDVVYVGCTVIAFEALLPQKLRCSWASWFGVRFGVALARTLVGTVVTSFTTLSSLTGSLFAVTNNVLLPIIGFYAVCGKKRVGPVRTAMHVIIFAFGVYMAVLGTYKSLKSLISDAQAPDVAIGSFPRHGISQECVSAYHRAVSGQ
eukprot:TRINITY_DN111157_c0_g1_i1.p1 TRINITY_DN111157_c0_g1~~TRINITY_DN111157_c0_g1_i1.p1  ORF type:complete len:506 (-),score=80.46 TRINITY_DN111157_c0_g1_i1:125-1585(-)